MTQEEIDNLRRLEKAATEGPWVTSPQTWQSKIDTSVVWGASGIEQDPAVYGDEATAIAYAQSTGQIANADAALIVAARNALPTLLDELEQSCTVVGSHARVIDRAREALLAVGLTVKIVDLLGTPHLEVSE